MITGASRGRESRSRLYCASKFGQVGFTRALEGELRDRGVRCGGVAPSFAIGTGREAVMPELKDMMSADDVADIVPHVLTRPPEPADPRDRDPPDVRGVLGLIAHVIR